MILLTILVSLATYRATRLIVGDTFPPAPCPSCGGTGDLAGFPEGCPECDATGRVSGIRKWVDDRFGDTSSWAYLVNCPWCASVYLGGAITLLTDLLVAGGLAAPVLVWATASAVSGYLSTLEPE